MEIFLQLRLCNHQLQSHLSTKLHFQAIHLPSGLPQHEGGFDLSKMGWLDGPTADNHLVGENFYKDYAAKEGLQVTENDPSIGLLQDFRILLDPD